MEQYSERDQELCHIVNAETERLQLAMFHVANQIDTTGELHNRIEDSLEPQTFDAYVVGLSRLEQHQAGASELVFERADILEAEEHEHAFARVARLEKRSAQRHYVSGLVRGLLSGLRPPMSPRFPRRSA